MWQDLGYALRVLRRNPGFAAVAIMTLALGIGVNVTLFSIVDAILLKPLPFRDSARLVDILEVQRKGTAEEVRVTSMHRIRWAEWRAQTHIFEGIEAERGPVRMQLGDTETALAVVQISPGLFPLLGLNPAIGRSFSPEEADGEHRVVLISDGLWKRVFGGAADAIGRQLSLDRRELTVIGIMPPEARYPMSQKVDAWVPLPKTFDPKIRGAGLVGIVARLRPGLTTESAQPLVDQAAVSINDARPASWPWSAEVRPIDPRHGDSQPAVLVAFGAVLFILATACANIANLLLARASTRHKEIATRRALGAGTARIARLLLIESLAIALIGAAVAIGVAMWLIQALPALLPPGLIWFPVFDMQLDWRGLLFAIGAALIVGAITGVLPALNATRETSEGSSLHQRTARTGSSVARRRTRNVLIGMQVAFALLLLMGAGLLTTSFVRMMRADAGYEAEGLQALTIILPLNKYPKSPAQKLAIDQMLEAARATPAIRAATFGTAPAFDGAGRIVAEDLQNDPSSDKLMALLVAGPDYFRVLGIPLALGRGFVPEDREGSPPVAIIDEDGAKSFWPGQNPLGRRIRYSQWLPWMTVVGVAKNVKTGAIAKAREKIEVYIPAAQASELASVSFLIRAGADAGAAIDVVSQQVHNVEPAAKITFAGPVEDLYGPLLVQPRFAAAMMSVFGALALLTALVGVYGVLSHTVAQRTPEIGIRIALGADARDVRRLVLRDALVPVAAGLACGILAARLATRVIASQLYNTGTGDLLTHVLVLGLFTVVSVLAASVPARRATRVDPLTALRSE